MSDDELDLALGDVFVEPPRPPTPEPTTATYIRSQHARTSGSWEKIDIRLVGAHPLWAHHLWNAARAFAAFLDRRPPLYARKSVLELGAGGGLPGIVAALNGARKVVLTDYPDTPLIDNLAFNVAQNVPPALQANVATLGYVWGTPADRLLSASEGTGFDLIILSDLIFNHSQHDALLRSCSAALRPPGDGAPSRPASGPPCVLVFYSHHRPHLAARDLAFFDKARDAGWLCEKVVEERFDPMFPDDPGEEEVRATVHGWKLTRDTNVQDYCSSRP